MDPLSPSFRWHTQATSAVQRQAEVPISLQQAPRFRLPVSFRHPGRDGGASGARPPGLGQRAEHAGAGEFGWGCVSRGRHPGRPLQSASHNPRRCAEGPAGSRPAHGFQHRQLSAVPLPRLPLQASHWITSPSLFLSSVTCSNDLEHVQVFFETPIRLHLGKSLELGDVLPSGCLASGRWGRGQRTGLGTQDRARACLREPAQSRIPAELPRNSNWVPGNSRLSVILG